MTIHVHFNGGRIGRERDVPDQDFATLRGGVDLPDAMYSFVRRHLASREVEVVTYADGTGSIIVGGFRPVGAFTWKEVDDA